MSLLLDDVYFNGLIQGTSFLIRSPVKVATTANITLSGAQTIDGVSAAAGDRVLVKNQTTASQNGIYVVASGSWSRAEDLPSGVTGAGISVFVLQGTVNAGIRFFIDDNAVGTSVIGTDNITFSQYINTTSTQTITQPNFSSAYFINTVDPTKRITFNVDNLSGSTTHQLPDASGELLVATSAQVLSNKTLTDNVTFISDDGDNTKKAAFELSGITTNTTQVLTVPDATGTLVTLTAAQTLTNKTLTSNVIGTVRDTNSNTILTTSNLNASTTYVSLSNGGLAGPSISAKLNESSLITDSDLRISTQGSGAIQFKASGGSAATKYYNSLGNYFELKAPDSMSENVTMQLPTTTPSTSKQMLKVQGSTGQLEFTLDRLTFTMSNTTNIIGLTSKLLVTTCFPWLQSYYGSGGGMEIEDGYLTYMYKATSPAFGRVLTVDIYDIANSTVLGTSTVTIDSVAYTPVRFQFTLPTTDTCLQMRISADGSGGSIMIYGGTLDLGKR
jgi:hypothetical protein